jgi:hypothetical protein
MTGIFGAPIGAQPIWWVASSAVFLTLRLLSADAAMRAAVESWKT